MTCHRPLRLLVALPSEARPVNRLLGLQRDNRIAPQRVYAGNGHLLLVTGIGRGAMTEGLEWLLAQPRAREALWLNIGIAGHPHRRIGEGVLVDRVAHNGQQRPLALSFVPPCPAEQLITVDEPCLDYPQQALYDMECWDFFRGLDEQGLRGLAFKVVSDNREHPVERLNAKLVSQLIEGQLEMIGELIRIAGGAP